MENKYYIPTIEEFHVGFEYEYFEPVNNTGWVKAEIHFFDEYNTTQDLHDNLKEGTHRPIRVKYLDREDIESLRFIKDVERSYSEHRDCFNKLDYCIDFYNDYTLIIKKANGDRLDSYNTRKIDTLFNGIIKNISELKTLLKQLNIE